jgi:hypothetical protein
MIPHEHFCIASPSHDPVAKIVSSLEVCHRQEVFWESFSMRRQLPTCPRLHTKHLQEREHARPMGSEELPILYGQSTPEACFHSTDLILGCSLVLLKAEPKWSAASSFLH